MPAKNALTCPEGTVLIPAYCRALPAKKATRRRRSSSRSGTQPEEKRSQHMMNNEFRKAANNLSKSVSRLHRPHRLTGTVTEIYLQTAALSMARMPLFLEAAVLELKNPERIRAYPDVNDRLDAFGSEWTQKYRGVKYTDFPSVRHYIFQLSAITRT